MVQIMPRRDIVDDLTNIVHPLPKLGPHSTEDEREHYSDWVRQVEDERHEFEDQIRQYWEDLDENPLLLLISRARTEMREAEKRMRLFVAYGREFVEPRPYRLEDLAAAAGMSISGTRTSYDDDEIADVAERLGRQPRDRKTP